MIQPFLPHIRKLIYISLKKYHKYLSPIKIPALSSDFYSPVKKIWISPYSLMFQETKQNVTTIFTTTTPRPPNTPMRWTSQQKLYPRKKGKNCPSLLNKGISIKNSLETTNSLMSVFCCSRSKSLVQILSLEISWDQVPFYKMVLSWRTFAYPVCPLWN